MIKWKEEFLLLTLFLLIPQTLARPCWTSPPSKLKIVKIVKIVEIIKISKISIIGLTSFQLPKEALPATISITILLGASDSFFLIFYYFVYFESSYQPNWPP